ncbi:MAG: orotate phosphoribosyltransferase [Chlorobi bacterium]|nr:orotate phosphoribosyltransferase [Chlorobiota bacterium]
MDLITDLNELRRTALDFFMNEGVLRFGDFTLKSGRKSPYFFNTGLLCSGRQLATIGHLYASMISMTEEFNQADVLFGSAYKGIPISVAAAVAFAGTGNEDFRAVSDRKETKTHGDKGAFLGRIESGDKAIIVDDVITDGATKMEALGRLCEADVVPLALVIAFDRQEPADDSGLSAVKRFEERSGVKVYSLLSVEDVMQKQPDVAETLKAHLESFTL